MISVKIFDIDHLKMSTVKQLFEFEVNLFILRIPFTVHLRTFYDEMLATKLPGFNR